MPIPQNDDLDDVGRAFTGFFLVVALLVVLVPTGLLFWGYNRTYRQCVKLENGLNLGYEAVFDLSRSVFRPIAVPKFADGTPLIRDDLWSIYVTGTTVYGESLASAGAGFRFAWRADAGLVYSHQDSALYDRLVANAGPANRGLGTGDYGVQVMMATLSKRPDFPAHRCPTALVTW